MKNMKKKIACCLLGPALLVSNVVTAETPCNPGDGPYVSIGVGVSKSQTWKRQGALPDTHFKTNPTFRFAVGSQFSNMRAEFEPSFSRGTYVTGPNSGHATLVSTLGNIYMGLPFETNFKSYPVAPYVGAGIGYSSVKISQNATPGQQPAQGSSTALAYQGIAGVRLALNEQVGLNIEYRYFATQKLNVAGKRIADHSANVGLTYRF